MGMKVKRKTCVVPLAPFGRLGVLGLGAAVIGGALFLASSNLILADDTNAVAAATSAPASGEVKTSPKAVAAPKRQLTGVELYAMHCNRCHPERDPDEFNQQQWQTLMLHMQVRANLPAAQARLILKYLQEEGGY